MKIGNHEFDTANETYIMGILNVTPDSFHRWPDVSTIWMRLSVMQKR